MTAEMDGKRRNVIDTILMLRCYGTWRDVAISDAAPVRAVYSRRRSVPSSHATAAVSSRPRMTEPPLGLQSYFHLKDFPLSLKHFPALFSSLSGDASTNPTAIFFKIAGITD